MTIDIPEVAEVRSLLEELGEGALIARLDSFVALNEGLESKKGEDFIKVSILGFLEGITTTLMMKYPGDERVARLHERVRARRAELDELFRKPAMRNLQ
ncbi:methyltransferase [Thermococcus celericrescens]|uniref:Methyltransferase n=2 Tax=Thermococcus TaxID=2263 RepID=A0A100XZZ1_9EURY|nr:MULTISPECIES: DUF3216 domain-containing protein [Thermococcus]KUH34744.1 methyltransferase [Thermococcus celericrescens]QEK13854.1 DUF3216 domain-containing protein [Thermococcus aciditolerans]